MTLRAIGAAASTIISRSRIPCCCCQIHRHHHRHQQLLRFLWSSSCSRRGRGRKVIDMASRDGELRAFMVAGEVSGDLLGARLMAALKKVSPFPVRFAGVGGALMNKEGLQTLFPMEDIAVMGIWELLPHLYKIRIHLKETVEAAVLFRPHVVVTIDSKGFSFRFLKKLKERCNEDNANPVHVHYVAPSFWAWKGGETRLGRLNEFIDHILCILPFEEEMCRSVGLSSTYVGHPLLEDALHLNPKVTACDYFSWCDPPSRIEADGATSIILGLLRKVDRIEREKQRAMEREREREREIERERAREMAMEKARDRTWKEISSISLVIVLVVGVVVWNVLV